MYFIIIFGVTIRSVSHFDSIFFFSFYNAVILTISQLLYQLNLFNSTKMNKFLYHIILTTNSETSACIQIQDQHACYLCVWALWININMIFFLLSSKNIITMYFVFDFIWFNQITFLHFFHPIELKVASYI